MNLARKIIKHIDRMITLILALLLLLTGVYAVYALWDNRQVYESAGSVQESLLKLKPKPSEEGTESDPGFEELQALNPDVCAWLSLEGTEIEYPVLQGRTNLSYISTDVYGKYSLAGSIFLDSRNGRNGEDLYNLVYGSMASVILLMYWMYLECQNIYLGAAFNLAISDLHMEEIV